MEVMKREGEGLHGVTSIESYSEVAAHMVRSLIPCQSHHLHLQPAHRYT